MDWDFTGLRYDYCRWKQMREACASIDRLDTMIWRGEDAAPPTRLFLLTLWMFCRSRILTWICRKTGHRAHIDISYDFETVSCLRCGAVTTTFK